MLVSSEYFLNPTFDRFFISTRIYVVLVRLGSLGSKFQTQKIYSKNKSLVRSRFLPKRTNKKSLILIIKGKMNERNFESHKKIPTQQATKFYKLESGLVISYS